MINIIKTLICMFLCFGVQAQPKNNFEEVISYKEKEGFMIVRVNAGGHEGDFILDSECSFALSESAAKKRDMGSVEPTLMGKKHYRSDFQAIGKQTVLGLFIGTQVYAKTIEAVIIKDTELFHALGVDGIIGFSTFQNVVLTINSRDKNLILSAPFRPSFIKLESRANFQRTLNGSFIDVLCAGESVLASLDLWDPALFRIANNIASSKNLVVGNYVFNTMEVDAIKVNGDDENIPVIGRGILKEGFLTIDFDRGKYYFQKYGNERVQVKPIGVEKPFEAIPGMITPIRSTEFLQTIYDYRKNPVSWVPLHNKPVVIDFWASWCAPCLKMMPIMEELALKYKGQIDFYKVNVDQEGELRKTFEANTIPLILFVDLEGKVVREVGADSKAKMEAYLLRLLGK